jgi:hypothetical protein
MAKSNVAVIGFSMIMSKSTCIKVFKHDFVVLVPFSKIAAAIDAMSPLYVFDSRV